MSRPKGTCPGCRLPTAECLCDDEDTGTGSPHVIPVNDLIEHQVDENCPCGPAADPVKRDDGSVGWLYVHHSLDGRELDEDRDGKPED